MKKIFCVFILGILTFSLVGCNNKNVATVNGVNITKDNYEKVKSILSVTNDYMNGKSIDKLDKKSKGDNKIEDSIVTYMIDNEILYEKAKKEGLLPSKKDVNEKYNEVNEQLESNPRYKSKLDKVGVNKTFLMNQISRDLAIDNYKKSKESKITVSDKEIQDYYSKHENEFNIEEVDASHILVSTLDKNKKPVSSDQKKKMKTKVDGIYKQLKEGKDFAQLAKQYSDDKSSGKNGGELGYFSRDGKNAEFSSNVFKLKKGDISNVFETDYGYHIVKLNNKRTRKLSFNDCRETIRKKIIDEKFLKNVESMVKESKVKR